MVDMNYTDIAGNIAGSGLIAIVLAWFMKEYSGLVQKLIGLMEKTTACVERSNETQEETKKALEEVAQVIVKCQGVEK